MGPVLTSLFAIVTFGLFGSGIPMSLSSLNRILGGHPATPGEFPYQVSIQVLDKDKGYVPACGGAILNPTTIVSAAHCTQADPEGSFQVVAGKHDLTIREDSEQARFVEQIVIHYGFDDFSFHNDVALYFLDKPLEFNEFVQPISLPPKTYVPKGSATVAGWGRDESDVVASPSSSGTSVLNKIVIPMYEDERCKEIYDEDFVEGMMFCAGSLEGTKDTCIGDSGGPLVSFLGGKKIIAGLVSFGSGFGCGKEGYLGVYTKLSSYTDWITYVIEYLGHGKLQ